MKIDFKKKEKTKQVSFVVTRKPLGTILDIILFLLGIFLLIGFWKGPVKWVSLVLILISLYSSLPIRKVIEHDKESKKIISKTYIGKLCIGRMSYTLKGPKWMYKPVKIKWSKKNVDKYSFAFGGEKYNRNQNLPWFNNLPNETESNKISKFLGLNPDFGVAYI